MHMPEPKQTQAVAVIGGGPAGLMAAETLTGNGFAVHLFDAMPSVGRKFLMAGKGGLNLTHSESLETFISRYGDRQTDLNHLLRQFGPTELRAWAKALGIDTFVGSSGRVFPIEMKAAPLLRSWLRRLRTNSVQFHMRHRWVGWTRGAHYDLHFETPEGLRRFDCCAVVLALGGASWPHLGSTGSWTSILQQDQIKVSPFRPSNCGFHVQWSPLFSERFAGAPVKNVSLNVVSLRGKKFLHTGEFVITKDGVEGGLIYSASSVIREMIETHGKADIHLDLCPNQSLSVLSSRLKKTRGKNSLSNHLRRQLGIHGAKAGLLREIMPPSEISDPDRLIQALKALKLTLIGTQPLTKAISSAGGVDFSELTDKLMLKTLPGAFCAGEMLDWEAPTGGYLLTSCFAAGKQAGLGALEWLNAFTAGSVLR